MARNGTALLALGLILYRTCIIGFEYFVSKG